MFQRETQGSIEIIAPEVALNEATAPKLIDSFKAISFPGQPMVVLNMANVPLLDSVGLETLLEIQQSLRQDSGSLKIAALTPLCQDVFRVTGLAEKFEVYDETKTAVRSFMR